MNIRMPSLAEDYWALESGEERHKEYPDKFWIPTLQDRQNLSKGNAAKLLFQIETEDEDGNIDLSVERMWVLTREKHGDFYIGILNNQPASITPESDFYLQLGAEVPFKAEHVIDIDDDAPEDYLEAVFQETPSSQWPIT